MALPLTVLAAWGCGRAKHAPEAAAPPATVARVATLRVGVPSPRRGNLLFNCDAAAVPHIGAAVYSADSSDPSGRRWLLAEQRYGTDPGLDDELVAGQHAPDTLIVRPFDDATDEEIALERGELDVAVFWPGEPSARMRSDERFRDPLLGLRSHGILACVPGAGDTLGPPSADMEMLNREAFGGDLLRWNALEPVPGEGPPARYTVDPALAGAKHLERILARIPSAGAVRTLKLVYQDLPTPRHRGLLFSRSASWPASGMLPVFALQCPVLTRPEAREAVRTIGANAFAELAPPARGTGR